MKNDSVRAKLAFLGCASFRFSGLLAMSVPLLGCGDVPEAGEETAQSQSAMIGGSAVSVATRRALGLVEPAAAVRAP
ncbi:MAG TPA: hypothetical protein VFZ53_26840 [Polyangiaceae bacterium]